MSPLCPICFTHYDVPCELGLSSLSILIPYLIEFKIPVIVKKKKKKKENAAYQIVTCHLL